jgi:hypothetical protein
LSDAGLRRAIAGAPERVGYPGALCLPRFKLAPGWRAPDLVLFPDPAHSARRLVLVEAERGGRGAAHRLVGRLLEHHARALGLGEAGLLHLRAVARALRDEGQRPAKLSWRRVVGTRDRAEAQVLLATGRRLLPDEIGLVALVRGEAAARRLAPIAAALRAHGLHLDMALAVGDDVKLDPAL